VEAAGHRPRRGMRRYRATLWALAMVSVFHLAFLAWAISVPPRPVWGYYADVEVPPSVAQSHPLEDVASRLDALGYNTSIGTNEYGERWMTVYASDNPDFRAFLRVWGTPVGTVSVEIRYLSGYLRPLPADLIPRLRASTAAFIDDTGLPVDGLDPDIGDNDFETWDEFGLFLNHLCLLVIGAGLVLLVLVVEHIQVGTIRDLENSRPPDKQ